MKSIAKYLILSGLTIFLLSCGPSDDEVRSLIHSELKKKSAIEYITEAQVVGPYSPAVRAGNFLFISGQLGIDPETSRLAGDDIESQTRQALDNLIDVLRKAGYDSSNVIQCSVFLKDINNFAKMNLIYGGYFSEGRYPARSTIEVSNLPRNAIVEIAAIAYKEFTDE